MQLAEVGSLTGEEGDRMAQDALMLFCAHPSRRGIGENCGKLLSKSQDSDPLRKRIPRKSGSRLGSHIERHTLALNRMDSAVSAAVWVAAWRLWLGFVSSGVISLARKFTQWAASTPEEQLEDAYFEKNSCALPGLAARLRSRQITTTIWRAFAVNFLAEAVRRAKVINLADVENCHGSHPGGQIDDLNSIVPEDGGGTGSTTPVKSDRLSRKRRSRKQAENGSIRAHITGDVANFAVNSENNQ
ncbi:hypothetical protein cyc_03047 [Cyclospora cayetanensis]|uniref:Uncharacterized protein n=1 Tax=Cyclospora cayetanensis TaxID=88456 RepID=A0A1D3D781_9EIME|nr:hypothetical protein cyc_03047 [Cyclospora cayetanensis]